MASLIWLGSLDPATELGLMAGAAIVVVFMSATQDVVIDAYRIEILGDEEQGVGSAMTQYGYRFGMLASGAGALFLSDHMAWSKVYAIEAALLVIGMVTILFAREPESRRSAGPAGSSATVLKEVLVDPFADFLKRPWWALLLVFVVLYRFPDVFLSVMANVFYKDLGFSNSEIASVSKLFGTGATLVGVFPADSSCTGLGVLKSLFLCGVVQMLSNLMYITMAQRGQDVPTFAATIAVENVSGGMTGVAFVAYLSSLCSPGFAGSQYALLSALGSLDPQHPVGIERVAGGARGLVLVLRGHRAGGDPRDGTAGLLPAVGVAPIERPAEPAVGAAAEWSLGTDPTGSGLYCRIHDSSQRGAPCTTPGSRPDLEDIDHAQKRCDRGDRAVRSRDGGLGRQRSRRRRVRHAPGRRGRRGRQAGPRRHGDGVRRCREDERLRLQQG